MKQLTISIITFSLVLFTLVFQNCARKKTEGSSQEVVSAQALAEQKSLAILTEKCASCHTGEAALQNGSGLNEPITDITNVNYLISKRLIIAGEPDLSPLYVSLVNADMPPGQPMSLAEVNTIKDWITNYNKVPQTPVPTATPIALAANFQSLRANVFLKKCYTCHINRTIKLDTFASVSGAITNQNLRGRVDGGTMPPATAPQLTAQEKSVLLQWIDAGAPNN